METQLKSTMVNILIYMITAILLLTIILLLNYLYKPYIR